MPYIIIAAITGCYWCLLETQGSHRPSVCDFLHPLTHYILQYLKVWHGRQGLLATKYSQVWALWYILPAERGDLSCLQFLSKCCGAEWLGNLSPDCLSYWVSSKGNYYTLGTALLPYTWSSLGRFCFLSSNQNVPDPECDPRVSIIDWTLDIRLSTGCPGQQFLPSIYTFLQPVELLPMIWSSGMVNNSNNNFLSKFFPFGDVGEKKEALGISHLAYTLNIDGHTYFFTYKTTVQAAI